MLHYDIKITIKLSNSEAQQTCLHRGYVRTLCADPHGLHWVTHTCPTCTLYWHQFGVWTRILLKKRGKKEAIFNYCLIHKMLPHNWFLHEMPFVTQPLNHFCFLHSSNHFLRASQLWFPHRKPSQGPRRATFLWVPHRLANMCHGLWNAVI